MSSKVQQERFEKALKQLLRQVDNKHCVHCGVLGPTYVVPKYGIFICTQCSAVQRDFARCKSVSMSKFDADEVEIMKKQGNGWAWKTYLADWNEAKVARPLESSRDPEKLKKWIRDVFEDKKFYKESTSNNQAEHSTTTSSTPSSVSPSPVFGAGAFSSGVAVQPAPAPVQAKAADFDPFGSMEIPATVTTAPPAQTTANTFDPFAASTSAAVTSTPTPPSEDFDPFAVAPSQPTPSNPTPNTTPNPQPPTNTTRGALPEDMFSFSIEPTNGLTTNGNTRNASPTPSSTPFPNAAPTPFPQQPNNMYYQPQQQQFPGQQQQWMGVNQGQGYGQGQGQVQGFPQSQQQWYGQGQGFPQSQQQYMYGIPQQQQFGGGFAYNGQYGQAPQYGTQAAFGTQGGFVPQQQGFGGQAAFPPQGQQQFGGYQVQGNPNGGVKQQKDEFDFFGDLMTGVGKTNGVQNTPQLGQPKAEGNPFA